MTPGRVFMGNPKALGEFEHLILLAIVRLDNDISGSAVTDELTRKTGREPARGTMYVTLDRLIPLPNEAARPSDSTPSPQPVSRSSSDPARLCRPCGRDTNHCWRTRDDLLAR
jgi:hypothetical protein